MDYHYTKRRVVEPTLFMEEEEDCDELCFSSCRTPIKEDPTKQEVSLGTTSLHTSGSTTTGEQTPTTPCAYNFGYSEDFLLATPKAYHFRLQFQNMASQFALLNEQFQLEMEKCGFSSKETNSSKTQENEDQDDTAMR